MDSAFWLLTSIVFLPAIGALMLAFFPANRPDAIRYFTLAVTVAVLAICGFGLLGNSPTRFDAEQATMQNAFNVPWIPSFQIDYFMGVDGISFPLLLLTAFVMLISMGASWPIQKYVKGYCILFLLLETGILGCFLALDFFLFYVFWEVMLLPMYFLIGVWGGPRREYAAIKFFLYTLVGSVLMLIAILMVYFYSDLRVLAETEIAKGNSPHHFHWQDLHVSKAAAESVGRYELPSGVVLLRNDAAADKPLAVVIAAGESATATYDEANHTVKVSLAEGKAGANDLLTAINGSPEVAGKILSVGYDPHVGSGQVEPDVITIPAYTATAINSDGSRQPVHTFNILALSAIGQHTSLFNAPLLWGYSLQWWAFLLLFIGFIIKVPSVPVHTWLPDAHVEAPTPISMILAGVLLKLGGYGIIRICYPICPAGGYELANVVCGLGVISMVYGAFAALAQKDFKRMVAYSSVSHMGYVLLGLGVWSARDYLFYNPEYWNMGVKGAMFQMIAHGISSPGMFLMVGIIYERVHHRNLDEFGGLFGRMPVYTAMAMGIFFAGLGLPGLCGFIGEVFVVLSVWNYSYTLAIISAAVVILTAAYILWAIQRVYLGPEYKGPHGDHISPSTARENVLGMVLLAGCLIMGIFPYQTVLRYMDATVNRQVDQLTNWTRYEKEVGPVSKSPSAEPVAAVERQ